MNEKMLWGTLEMLVLEVLARGPSYGYQITQEVLRGSGGKFAVKEGSLYPALHRLERRKLLSAGWVESPEGRRRKYYRLTGAGRRELEARRKEWKQFSEGVSGVLGGAGARS
jgi:transcriptional regulator